MNSSFLPLFCYMTCASSFNVVAISRDLARSLIRSAYFSSASCDWRGSDCAADSVLAMPV